VPKKVLGVLALLLVGWFLLTRPEDAADTVQAAWNAIINAFEAIVTFLTGLFD
jgi:hypothetical protein